MSRMRKDGGGLVWMALLVVVVLFAIALAAAPRPAGAEDSGISVSATLDDVDETTDWLRIPQVGRVEVTVWVDGDPAGAGFELQVKPYGVADGNEFTVYQGTIPSSESDAYYAVVVHGPVEVRAKATTEPTGTPVVTVRRGRAGTSD